MSGDDTRPLVVHILYRFETGGLEQVLLDTVLGTSTTYQHAIVSLTSVSPLWAARLPADVQVFALGKRDGQDPRIWLKVAGLLWRLSPKVVQTYNIACLEFQAIAFLLRVPFRAHAEHGRSADDPNGLNPKYRFLRRRLRSVVHAWVAVSRDLHDWLRDDIGIHPERLVRIYNGIDVERFRPIPCSEQSSTVRSLDGFCSEQTLVVGTVGRLDPVKNQAMLIDVWRTLDRQAFPQDCVLAIVGGGALEKPLRDAIDQAELSNEIWLPGMRSDISALMPRFDIFVLPSIAEGLPITLLEAMACACPVIVSDVGGMPEAVTDGAGLRVLSDDREGWKQALNSLCSDGTARRGFGDVARERVVAHFNRVRMLESYEALYTHGAVGVLPYIKKSAED